MAVVAMGKKSNENVDTGIDATKRQKIAEALSHALADTYALYTKTQFYHWNVTGPRFRSLHLLFEEQYTALAAQVDEVAERIRSLGYPAPGGFKAFQSLTSLKEDSSVPDAETMIANLLSDRETISRSLRKTISLADDADDVSTADMLTGMLEAHEKTAWMLRSHLGA